MPYTKTPWVNDSPPAISAENLDKMEQGIADAMDIAEAAQASAEAGLSDTGARNITQALFSAFTSAQSGITLERVGNTVTFGCYARQFDKAVPTAVALPEGFRPSVALRAFMSQGGTFVNVDAAGNATPTGISSTGSYVSWHITWTTRDTWPVALPGTAA